MFSNQLLSSSLSLNQQHHQYQQQPVDDSFPNQQNDITFFDKYISQASTNNAPKQPQTLTNSEPYQSHNQQSTTFSQTNHLQATNSTHDNQSQLYFLKQHLSIIESIAMKEIQELKRLLEEQRLEKELVVEQLESVKKQNKQKRFSSQIGDHDIVRLLKEQNKMLKQALKKQLHINKNLIRTSITNHSQSQLHQLKQQQANKQNDSLTSNYQQQQPNPTSLPKPSLFDRPSIPLPTSQLKKTSLR